MEEHRAPRPRDPTDPADPAYDWGALDGAVRDARARGLDPLFTVYRAPEWHLGPQSAGRGGRREPGSRTRRRTAISAKALATRYSGNYGGLPAVHKFEAWNEPNIPLFLSPQYEGGTPFAAEWYRGLLNSFRAGVTAVSKKNKVISAGMAPYGDPPGGLRTRPLAFLRQLFCLKKNLKARKCPDKASFDIAGAHPITIGGGPTQHAINRDDAATADFPEIRATLRAAERHHTVKPRGKGPTAVGHRDLVGDQSPRQRAGSCLARQAGEVPPAGDRPAVRPGGEGRDQLSDRRSPRQRRLPSQRFIAGIDRRGACRFDTQAGLFFVDGTREAVAHRLQLSAGHAAQEQAPGEGLRARHRAQGSWSSSGRRVVAGSVVKRRKVNAGQTFSFVVRQRGTAKFRAKVGGARSLVWHQGG